MRLVADMSIQVSDDEVFMLGSRCYVCLGPIEPWFDPRELMQTVLYYSHEFPEEVAGAIT